MNSVESFRQLALDLQNAVKDSLESYAKREGIEIGECGLRELFTTPSNHGKRCIDIKIYATLSKADGFDDEPDNVVDTPPIGNIIIESD